MMTAKGPPDYHASHCGDAIECLSQGHTVAAFAGQIGVSRDMLLAWAHQYPDFADALKVGQAKAVAFWERMLADIARSGKGNATAAIFALKNCADEGEDGLITTGKISPENDWSDMELARRIAHIFMRAEESELKINDRHARAREAGSDSKNFQKAGEHAKISAAAGVRNTV